MIGSVATRATQQAMRVGGRQLHGSAISRGAGGGGYDYLHAKYMYNFRNKPGSKLRVGGLIALGVSTGVAIPCFAVWFNQRKKLLAMEKCDRCWKRIRGRVAQHVDHVAVDE